MSDWKDLTDYEIEEILLKQDRFWKEEEGVGGELFIEFYGEKFALAIQEALRVKNEEMTCIKLLADIRQACGDDGKRMQDELVQYIAELYRQAERVKHLQVRVNGFEDTLKRQANAAKSGMDAAKKAASQSEKNAKRLLAESNPASLESERAMNEELTHEIDMLQDSLIWQGKMLAAIANVIKGPPEEGSLHSTHDVVEGVERLQARVQLEQEQDK
jgi:hypothetical protein